MRLYRRAVPEPWSLIGDLYADGTGIVVYDDLEAVRGRSYEYKLGLLTPAGERQFGEARVDFPLEAGFALERLPDGASGHSISFAVTLGGDGPATLEFVDVSGRRQARSDLGGLGPGEHRVSLDAISRPGVYWARLSQAGRSLSIPVAVLW